METARDPGQPFGAVAHYINGVKVFASAVDPGSWECRADVAKNPPKIRRRVIYEILGNALEFVPCRGVPGYSHRVIINGKASDWMSDECRPSGKVAMYFYQKHCVVGE